MGQGVRQADLARRVGISPSYLNLIEHNRRRIGGKLLLLIAAALEVEPATLSEGAEEALIATLRDAAAARPRAGAEVARLDEFAGRFPGWARLLSDEHSRAEGLEQEVEALTDRLAHDPHLAASLHEVLSTVTAIHSAAEILVGEDALEPEWQHRFHRNITEDSQRLAEGAQRLVAELDMGQTRETAQDSPQEDVARYLDRRAYHLAALEVPGAGKAAIEALLSETEGELGTAAARFILRRHLHLYAADAARLPQADLLAALDAVPGAARAGGGPTGPDPVALAHALEADIARVMRRLATLPAEALAARGLGQLGLVICDASGTLTFRKPLAEFPLPRFGAACPLWPLFRALSRPMTPLRDHLRLAGRTEGVFAVHAIATPQGPPVADRAPDFAAHMLIRAASGPVDLPGAATAEAAQHVGVTCRICQKSTCPARREPSILTDGF